MISSNNNSLFRWRIDRYFARTLFALAAAMGLLLVLVLAFLTREMAPLFAGMPLSRFFTDSGWYPLEGQFGIMPMVWASLAAALGAIVLALPLGLACALFMQFFISGALSKTYQLMLALMAGVPSVIYGLWGLTVLVPLMAQWQPPGANLLSAILILAIMILPTVALTCLAALRAVPPELLQGAAALGLTRQAVLLGVVIPAARQGILGGVLLAAARALGETMAVLMVAGNVVQMPGSLFDSVRVLTANIALEMAYATGDHRAGLFASGLLLTLLVMTLAWLAARFARGHHV